MNTTPMTLPTSGVRHFTQAQAAHLHKRPPNERSAPEWHESGLTPSHRRPPAPRFVEIEVRAPVRDDVMGGHRVGSFFSAGIDSSFSLIEAAEALSDLIFIRDFEGRYSPADATSAAATVATVANAFGKQVIFAETNFKEVFRGCKPSRTHFYGTVLAATALSLQGTLGEVHIPSSYDIRNLMRSGSHPLLDPLWSTTALNIVYDRVDVSRLEKTAAIASNDILLENLRVCDTGRNNCGHCGKCVRTVFTLQALGCLEYGKPFRRGPVTVQELARLDLRNPSAASFIEDVVDYVSAGGGGAEWARAFRIARSGRYHKGFGKILRGDLRERILLRVANRLALKRNRRPS